MFFDLYSCGAVSADRINDFISAWHASDDEERRSLAAYLDGVCVIGERLVAVLDLDRLLRSPEIRQFEEPKEEPQDADQGPGGHDPRQRNATPRTVALSADKDSLCEER